MSNRLVIIGGGQAAFACAAKMRALGDTRPITILAGENALPYQRPPLSKKYLLGEMSLDRLAFRPAEWYSENDVDLRLGELAVSIDREKSLVHTKSKEAIEYSNLLFATGSSPYRLPAKIGGELDGVYTIRKVEDVDRLKPVMVSGARVLIVGGGYIGLEAAAVARQLGMEVTLIEASERILSRVAAPETADVIRTLHLSKGVKIHEKTKLIQLHNQPDGALSAELDNGNPFEADIVIAGIGAYAEDELARAAGIDCDSGILVDEFGRTSDSAIYAAGDCASMVWRGQRVRLESVQNAVDQAENAAENLCGAEKPYRPQPWFWSDQYDLKLQIAGLNRGYQEAVFRQGAREGSCSVWYFKEDQLLAVDAMNDAKAYVTAKRLLESGKVRGLKAKIEDVSLDIKTLL